MLAIISNYYNPSENPIKLRNYKLFRESIEKISSDLFLIEVSFNGKYSLSSNETFLQLESKDIIWQQHRLFNLAIEKIPSCYDKVAWVDCDLIFENLNWIEETNQKLEKSLLIQLFQTANWLNYDLKTTEKKMTSSMCNYKKNNKLLEGWPGFAWAAKRDHIQKHKIYDYWITGSNDIALFLAATGNFNTPWFDLMNSETKQHYMNWANNFYYSTNNKLDFVSGTVNHLWHGNLINRKYRERWKILKKYYDPEKDITIGKTGCFEWNSQKPELHKTIEKMCKTYDMEIKCL